MNNYWKIYYPAIHLIFLLLMAGCVEQYFPDEDELKTGTVVVDAHLTGTPGLQSIRLSRSSAMLYPKYDPLPGCYVRIENLDGNLREFEESETGKYTCYLDEHFLEPENEFRILFITSEGSSYQSQYEKLNPPVAIESIYWEKEYHGTTDPDITLEGVQFYLDFRMDKESGKFLRWQLHETYEIHNPEYESFVVDQDRRVKELSDSVLWRRCWISSEIPSIYSIDLEPLEGEKYRHMPLNFVSNETRRLNLRYSLLVQQFSLSQNAYTYWNELGENLQSMGGMFDKQPQLTQGNICNVDNEEEIVLGYFSISGVSEQRIFLDRTSGIDIRVDPEYCFPGELPAKFHLLVRHYPSSQPPMYLSVANSGGKGAFGVVEKCCVDCREYKGSTHIKPDFW